MITAGLRREPAASLAVILHQVVCVGSSGTPFEPAEQPVALGDAGLSPEHGAEHPRARFIRLDKLLPLASHVEDTPQCDSDAEDMAFVSVLLPADKLPSPGHTESIDPFAPSLSALPDSTPPQSSTLLQHMVDAAANASQNGEGINLLDADMADVQNLPSGSEPSKGLAAAEPVRATAGQANQGSAQMFPNVHDLASRGSSALSVDSDDFAESTPVSAADVHPPSYFSQPQRSFTDMPSNAQSGNQATDHSATAGDHQHLQQQQGTGQQAKCDRSKPNASAITSPTSTIQEGAQAVSDVQPTPADGSQNYPDVALGCTALETRHQAIPADVVNNLSQSTQEEQQQQQQQPPSQDENSVLVMMPKPEAMLKPHEAAMAKAENAERRLLTGDAACGLTKAVKILVVLALLGLNSAHGVFGAITWLVGVSHSLLNLA